MSRPDGYLVPGRLDAQAVVAEVARGFQVSVADIMGDSRKRHILVARSCAMAVVRQHTDWSWQTIAYFFNKCCHETVRGAIAKVEGDPELCEAVRLVVEELNPPPRLFAVSDEEEAV